MLFLSMPADVPLVSLYCSYISFRGTAGDHKGPPLLSLPPSPLREGDFTQKDGEPTPQSRMRADEKDALISFSSARKETSVTRNQHVHEGYFGALEIYQHSQATAFE